LIVAIVVGCATGTPNVQKIPVSADPSEQIEALSRRVEQSRQIQAPVLSPTWFGRAESSLHSATKLREKGGAVGEILNLVAQGNAQIEQATKFTKVSENVLPSVIDARMDARTAGAASLGEPYDEAEKAFLELTAAVENDNVSWAERRSSKVENEFRAVELRAIKARSENDVRDLIKQARAAGAEKLVPKTLAETEEMRADLDAFITENRYATNEMNERSGAMLFQAKRLVSLTQEAAAIQKASPEEDALERERNITSVAKELALPDLRDQDFGSQVATVTNAVRELRSDRDYLVTQTKDLRYQLAKIESESTQQSEQLAQLEAQRRFNDLYNQVSKYFTKDEAEVYKQGTQLVVRLRGIQFPVGDSVLQPQSYELLSKVQMAIRSFGDPSVVIEGHTDTTGSSSVNEHLSERRAEAVEKYLVANNTLPADRITAVGKGSSDPLAPNDTEAGRALNRRIDIRIDASGESVALPSVASGPPGGAKNTNTGK
jgi:outer membrane protein OmpA-like peptidoglycan-associated protein